MNWQLALALVSGLFGVFIVWRVRPAFGPRRVGKAHRQALADARARLASATTPEGRARALGDAGDACAATAGSLTSALGYYLRAMRTDPTSPEPIVRAARGLGRRPRTLESILWRRLGQSPWDGPNRAPALAALAELGRLYAGSLRNRGRARAVRHALAALGAPADLVGVPSPADSAAELAPR